MMCLAVWGPRPQLQIGDRMDGMHAWYKKAFKLFFLVGSCTARAIPAFIEAGEVLVILYLVEPQYRLKKQGF